jgi:hypothetical protein
MSARLFVRVSPVGTQVRVQELVRVTRISQTKFRREDLADVCFVPLLGKEGWEPEAEPPARRKLQVVAPAEQSLPSIIANAAQLGRLLNRSQESNACRKLRRAAVPTPMPARERRGLQELAPNQSNRLDDALGHESG